MVDESKAPPKSNSQVLFFIVILCLICGFLLSFAAFALAGPQNKAKEFDQVKQMLIAAKILNNAGTFQILESDGTVTPATFETNVLVPVEKGVKAPLAKDSDIEAIGNVRIRPLLTDSEGNIMALEDKGVDLAEYLEKNKKTGYAKLPSKLFYVILPNTPEAGTLKASEIAKDLGKADSIIIPVSGFGLWAPIYGYLAIAKDGDTVIGTTWYEMAETPGLGANITESWWQKQFYGKEIFQQTGASQVDYATASIGIIVVKGKVKDVYGSSPRAKSAVDGMSGATLTGDGVTAAYRDSLTPYRSLFIKLKEKK